MRLPLALLFSFHARPAHFSLTLFAPPLWWWGGKSVIVCAPGGRKPSFAQREGNANLSLSPSSTNAQCFGTRAFSHMVRSRSRSLARSLAKKSALPDSRSNAFSLLRGRCAQARWCPEKDWLETQEPRSVVRVPFSLSFPKNRANIVLFPGDTTFNVDTLNSSFVFQSAPGG